jgi:flagellar biosynthetic protein FlhB
MTDERNIAPGARRVERIMRERGAPIRRTPIAAGALVGGAAGCWAGDTGAAMLDAVRTGLADAGIAAVRHADATAWIGQAMSLAAWPATGAVIGAALGAVAQGAGPWKPMRAGRLRMPVGAGALGGGAVRVASGACMLAAGAAVLWSSWQRVGMLPAVDFAGALEQAGEVVIDAVAAGLGAGLAFAAADVAVARWRFGRSMRMTAAEAREEQRLEHGDPSWRARRRGQGRQLVARLASREERHGRAA